MRVDLGDSVELSGKLAQNILNVSQNFQHTLGGLLFRIYPINKFAIFVVSNNDVFGRGDHAVLDTAIAADLVLVGTGMEKPEVQWFAFAIDLG